MPAAPCWSCAAPIRASPSPRSCSPAAARYARRRNAPRSPPSAPGAQLDVAVLDLPDGRVPTRWERAKLALEELRTRGEPDLIFAPLPARRPPGPPHAREARAHRVPRPPDPRLRDPQVGRRPRPADRVPPARRAGAAGRRSPSCTSTTGRSATAAGSTAEVFGGLARVRGVQCHARYAEAFHVAKLVLGAAPLLGVDLSAHPSRPDPYRGDSCARSVDRSPGLPGYGDGPGPGRGRPRGDRPGQRPVRRLRARLAGRPGRADARGGPARRHGRAAGRVRRRGAPGRAVERPAGLARARDHLRHQPPCVHPTGPAGQGRGGGAVRLRLDVLGVRGAVGRRAGRRGCAAAAR